MQLQENQYYHIYNRGINGRTIFREAKDYQQFIESYRYYCFLAIDTYAYCLLNNHFHFLIRPRSTAEQKKLFDYYHQHKPAQLWGLTYDTFRRQDGSTQYGHLFNSYTRWFNTRHGETGSKIEGRFKRKKVDTKAYRAHLLCYIHRNPIHHHLVEDYQDYRWSSYHSFGDDRKDPLISCKKVYPWFDGRQGFEAAHEEMKLKLTSDIKLE